MPKKWTKNGGGNHHDHRSRDVTTPLPAYKLEIALIESLDVLGEKSILGILIELALNGINLSDPSAYYSLEQLEPVFHKVLGRQATPILLERITQELDRQEEADE